MATVRADEGRRVLRNVTSFGAFLFAPLHMALMARALGQDGYGRWWGAFVVLEAASIIGMLAADLYVRREVPRLTTEGHGEDEVLAVIGSSLALVSSLGLALAGVQIALASTLAAAHHDPELFQYVVVLAAQPVLGNLAGVLAAALQSRDVLGPVAVLRGIVMPLVVSLALYVGWRGELSTLVTLLLLVAATVLALLAMLALYARHFSLSRTLRHAFVPRRIRKVAGFGLGLLVPAVLFTVAGKVDVYIIGSYVAPAAVGMYAACLQMASMLPNTRSLFEPIVQNQIGALEGRENVELGASLRRLSRMCAFALAPIFIFLLSVGQPIMGILLGHEVSAAVVPLAILSIGQIVGGVALASWIVPMTMPGRYLGWVAGITLVVKVALLLLLIPIIGLVGAAIATAVGTIVPQQLQAWFGRRRIGQPIYSAGMIAVIVVSAGLAYGGRLLFTMLSGSVAELTAGMLAGAAALAAFALVLPLLLTAPERERARTWISNARSSRLHE